MVAAPVVWGSGFHRIKGHNFHIANDLYLFHFGYFDLKRIEDRCNDQDRLAQGWGKHVLKRAKTIRLVTEGAGLRPLDEVRAGRPVRMPAALCLE